MWKNVAFSEPSGRSQLISLVRQSRVPATAFVIFEFLCWWYVFFCVDRGLLQLIAFCSLQVLDRSFYLCVFFTSFFLHVSAYICMFLTFSVRSFRANAALAFCKCCCRKATKILNNCVRIHPKSIKKPSKIHPKSIQNPSQMHPKPTTLVTRSYPTATLRK